MLSLRFQRRKMQKCLQNVLLNIYQINGGFNLYNIFHLYKYSIELAEHNCKCKMRYNLVLLKVTIISTSEPRISLLVSAVTFFFFLTFYTIANLLYQIKGYLHLEAPWPSGYSAGLVIQKPQVQLQP